MPVLISLLRGINVGGHKIIKMDALRALYASLGMRDVRTYIQSGNVVCRSAKRATLPLETQIEKAIESAFGFHSDVMLRTVDDMRAVVEANPFAGRAGIEPDKLAAVFLRGAPGRKADEILARIPRRNEELRLVGRELFVYFPDGMGQSKTPAGFERALGTFTARNWNTVRKLLEMAESLGD